MHSCNGGVQAWQLNKKVTVKGKLSICSWGLHVTYNPQKWLGERFFIAECEGIKEVQDDKILVRSVTLVLELTPILMETCQKAIAPAWETCQKAIAPAWETCQKAIAPAWETYQKAEAPALETYQKAEAPAWETYQKAIAPAWETCQKAIAPALETYQKAEAPAWETCQKAIAPALEKILNENKKA